MIRIAIFVILFLQITSIFGQSASQKDSTKKWSIEVTLVNQSNNYIYKTFSPNYVNGILFKRHFDQFSIRVGVEQILLVDNLDKPYASDQVFTNGAARESVIRFGIGNKLLANKFVTPLYGVDLSYVQISSYRELSGGWIGDQKVSTQTSGLGFNPVLGIQFRLSRSLYASLENRIRFFAYKLNQEIRVDNNIVSNSKMNNIQYVSYYTGSILINLNFNF